jgi:hypothetical protein
VLFGLVIDVFGLSAQFFVGVLSVALVVGVWAATNARPVWERG